MGPSSEITAEHTTALEKIRQLAPDVGSDAAEVLADLYSSKQIVGTESDEPIGFDAIGIDIGKGAQLNELVRQSKITKSLEIGFANGLSTIWILDALRSHIDSHHTAIDPFELTQWGGIGLHQVKRLDGATRFEWIGEPSVTALPKFIKDEKKFDFIFIDGNHRFDDVLVDFYLSDQLIRPGGFVAFDDTGMPSIATVIDFVLTNRHYEFVRKCGGDIVVLKKLGNDTRDWHHFKTFKVHKDWYRFKRF